MKIAVIGAGNVGGRLGTLWAERGHQVTFGVRNPAGAKARALAESVGARFASVGEAARSAEVVVLAVPWGAARDALREAGDLDGTVLVDATNPFGAMPGGAQSGGEEIARWEPGARVVKAFNSLGAENLENLDYAAGRAAGFYCGDNAAAKETARGLIEAIGFEPVDVGPLASAPLLESLARLWITLARSEGRGIAFAVLRR